eukprot:Pgem_evm1s6608
MFRFIFQNSMSRTNSHYSSQINSHNNYPGSIKCTFNCSITIAKRRYMRQVYKKNNLRLRANSKAPLLSNNFSLCCLSFTNISLFHSSNMTLKGGGGLGRSRQLGIYISKKIPGKIDFHHEKDKIDHDYFSKERASGNAGDNNVTNSGK